MGLGLGMGLFSILATELVWQTNVSALIGQTFVACGYLEIRFALTAHGHVVSDYL